MKEYYNQKRVSNSLLKYFQKSPKLFKSKLDNLENIQEDKKYLDYGRNLHMLILEPEQFNEEFTVLDFDLPKSAQQLQFCQDYVASTAVKAQNKAIEALSANYSTKGMSEDKVAQKGLKMAKECIQYIKYLWREKQGKKVLTMKEYKTLMDAKELILEHEAARLTLFNDDLDENITTVNELELYWNFIYKDIDIPCKSMIDRLIIEGDSATIVDLKTSSEQGGLFQKGYFDPYNYIQQLAFYSIALSMLDEYKHINNIKFVIVCVTSNEVYTYNIDENLVLDEVENIKNMMIELWWHWKHDTWEHRKEYYDNNGFENITINKKQQCTN